MRSPYVRAAAGILAFLAALAGGAASTLLTYEYAMMSTVAESQPDSAPAEADETTAISGSIPNEKSFYDTICTGFENSDCEQVSQSKWGRFPFGQVEGKPSVPTSELGLIYYIFVICWLLWVRRATSSRWYMHFLFLLVTSAGLGASVFFDVVMWTALDVWCPFCLTAHISSLLIFICSLLLWPRTPKPGLDGQPLTETDPPSGNAPAPQDGDVPAWEQTPSPRPWPTFAVVVTTLVVFVLAVALQHFIWLKVRSAVTIESMGDSACQKQVAGYKWYASYWKKQYNRYDDRWQFVYMSWMYEPAIPIVTDGEPFRGPEDAPHTIVLFSDIQCPACARLEDYLQKYILPAAQKYGGAKVIFKHYPICLSCNPYAGRDLHPKACLAAKAIEAARILGGNDAFWKMHDWLHVRRVQMKNQEKDWFVAQGKALGFDANDFAKAMDSKQAMDRIHQHIEEAQLLGKGYVPDNKLDDYKVTGTPTVIVDNRTLRTKDQHRAWLEIFRKPAPAPPAGMDQPRAATPAPEPVETDVTGDTSSEK